MEAFDDAAVMVLSGGRIQAQTVDFFRTFIPDPYLFGQIATEHCLNDLFAMGTEPRWAQALATIAFGSPSRMEEQLFQVLSGTVSVLNRHRVALTGGHTSEGEELVFGLVVSGVAAEGSLLTKKGLCPGDAIVLTKALGTGVLLAAARQGIITGDLIYHAADAMLLSNRRAAEVLRCHGASACTDVTGFGLIGHLDEMLQCSEVGAELIIEQIPFLAGAVECSGRGVVSSLFPENARREETVQVDGSLKGEARYNLLYDPQTAGGLLAGVAATRASACVEALRKLGYPKATIVGTVWHRETDSGKRISVS
jgi:selenide,water dikinase